MANEGTSEQPPTLGLSAEKVEETRIIEESIIQTDITPQNTQEFATLFVQDIVKGYEGFLKQRPGGLSELRKGVEFMQQALQEAQAGNLQNLSEVVRSEAIKSDVDPQRRTLAAQLYKIADNLTLQTNSSS